MSDSSLSNLVKSLQDNQPASIQLSTTDGYAVSIDCMYKESHAPSFFVVVPPGSIPENVNTSAPCLVTLQDETGTSFAINARILDVASERSIELTATKAIDPISLREYFRVDLRTAMTISHETMNPDSSRNWSIKGQTLDISGSGVLGLFSDAPQNSQSLFIEIRLTHPEKSIQCIGHVVRTNRLRGGRWQVALHFDNITSKDRDSIITNCLWEQRRQLRERVQTAEN
ncbi:PilZ domain-containing protein [Desulfopila aestuarii]|uniref:PilZ domain-containing protein n=1 Tax=Desulfopila aestuarii DSM 18488 TaxID=1121416 RepID=A0A1M7YDS5_9BACT|nr:PilZ domain-containing protein [Desulfopila aestuarii]SHO50785.1 PilZ domain-containing protein [Desulfopila aestuarii DSM 18488]